jgi:hypothetical protein
LLLLLLGCGLPHVPEPPPLGSWRLLLLLLLGLLRVSPLTLLHHCSFPLLLLLLPLPFSSCIPFLPLLLSLRRTLLPFMLLLLPPQQLLLLLLLLQPLPHRHPQWLLV